MSLSLFLASCGAPRPEAEGPSSSKGVPVVTTFLPITLFTRAVAGDCATVTPLIIPSNTGPHDFQAKPGDLAALRQARVLVKNGLEMEGFLDKLVASAGNRTLGGCCALLGLLGSGLTNLPSGPCVVIVQFLGFVLALLLSQRTHRSSAVAGPAERQIPGGGQAAPGSR